MAASVLCASGLISMGCGDTTAPADVNAATDTSASDINQPTDVTGDTSDTGNPDLKGPGTCDTAGVRLLRLNPWQGSGLQLYVEWAPQGGGDFPAAPVMRPTTSDAAPVQSFTASYVAVPHEAGLTGILIVPSADSAIHAQRLAAARAVIDGLPTGERIALWLARTGKAPMLLSDLTEDRAHVTMRLDVILAMTDPSLPDPAVSETTIDDVRELLAEAEGRWGALWKSLIVVADSAAVRATTDPAPAVVTYYLVASNPAAAPDTFAWDAGESATPATAAAALVDNLKSRRAAIYRLGACPSAVENQPFTLVLGDVTCIMDAPAPFAHLLDEACVAGDAAADRFDYGDTIALVMTDAEKAVWDDRHAAKSKDDFRLSVKLGQGTAIPASAHFRGQTSMDCQRKNYDVNLDGGASRRLMPGGGGDEFYLISMCKDEGFYNQLFANTVLSGWDVFSLKFRVVRLMLNDENQGLYILMQEPSDTVVKRHVALDGIVRRAFDPDPREKLEVKHTTSNEAATLAYYLDMIKVATDGPAGTLLADLSEVLDVSLYMRWMATMTFLHNGDYIDEIFFYGSIEKDTVPWWRPLSWDADDLFSTCHHGGQYALPDANGMLYCAEGFLDKALTRSPEVYDVWATQLEWVMGQLSQSKARTVMDGIRDQLFAVLDDDTAAALVEFHASHPEATTAAGAKAAIQSMMDAALEDIEASRTSLTTKLDAYRDANP